VLFAYGLQYASNIQPRFVKKQKH